MEDSLRLTNLPAVYLGARVAPAPASPEAITSISRCAYRGLNHALHEISTHPKKTTLLGTTHESIRMFIPDLEQITSEGIFDARYPHDHRSKEFGGTYGQAQKWLNMTLKYLAVTG